MRSHILVPSLFVWSVFAGGGQAAQCPADSKPSAMEQTGRAGTPCVGGQDAAPQPDLARVKPAMAALRLPFIANSGQTNPRVRFYAPTFAGTVYVTGEGELHYGLPATGGQPAPRLSERFLGGKVAPVGVDPAGQVSYFIGARSGTTVESYNSVSLGEVFPGVEVALNAHGNNVEKIFILAPGVDGQAIRMGVEGAKALRAVDDGSLALVTAAGEVRLSAPVAWQERDGRRLPVNVAYRVAGNAYGFQVGPHDAALPVVIDPLLQASYLGGNGTDYINSIVVHPTNGDVYVAGYIKHNDEGLGLNFPLGEGSGGFLKSPPKEQKNFEFGFIARISPDLAHHKQTTFFGSESGNSTIVQLLAHPQSKELYALCRGLRTGWPGMEAPYPKPAYLYSSFQYHPSPYFISRFSEDLTQLGQSTEVPSYRNAISRIGIHPGNGSIYVVGTNRDSSEDVPGLSPLTPYQDTCKAEDAFLLRINKALTAIEAATCFGGTESESGVDLAFHSGGDVYLLGSTDSTTNTEFPPTDSGAQPEQASRGSSVSNDAFVARLGQNLDTLKNATFLGGTGVDNARAIAYAASTDSVFVTGTTGSKDFPQLAGGALDTLLSFTDSFLARLSGDLRSHTQSTVLTADDDDRYKPLLHPNGDIYVVGTFTNLHNEFRRESRSGFRRFSSDLKTIKEETYLTLDDTPHEGVDAAISPLKNATTGQYQIYVAGNQTGGEPLFPSTAGGFQPESKTADGYLADAFIAKYSEDVSNDIEPDAFNFGVRDGVPLGSVQTSSAAKITGINLPAPLRVEGGEYSLNCDGKFTASPSSVTGQFIRNGQTVCVRQTASDRYGRSTETKLTVGKGLGAFRVTTVAEPTPTPSTAPTPNPTASPTPPPGQGPVFPDRAPDKTKIKKKVKKGQLVMLGKVKLKGLTAPVGIAVEDGEYSIGCKKRNYTDEPGIIPGDDSKKGRKKKVKVCVRHFAAAERRGEAVTRLLIGDKLYAFKSLSK